MEDIELVKLIKKGETKYFEEIIKKYKKVVFGHAYNFLRNKEEAEDTAQEVFIAVYRSLNGFRGDSKLSTWIYRITINTCKNRLKQLQRLRAQTADEFYEEGDENRTGMVDNIREKEEKEPDKSYASDRVKDLIYTRIDELTQEQKQVIMMRDVDGLSYEDIGRVLKLSVSAVKSKLFRARENLREKLEHDDVL